ncbi:DMT family transporter [Nocardioides sp.]|uniref:DMT family transporter n=1 Tax=Nocardioides sp. TaxID=35761 RepID=UPI00273560EA|nr:DMT family transporter [Nocardioides sp.]MDP3894245.1 DMT family transporter [Nocardioides sp.]
MITTSTRHERAHARHSTGLLLVCLAGVLWGTGGLTVTFLHDHSGMGALAASGWRMAIAAAGLIALAGVTGRLTPIRHGLHATPAPLVALGLCTATYQGLYFLAVLQVGVAVSTVVALGLAPLLVSGWEHARRRSLPSPGELAVLAAALAGLVLVSTASGHAGGPRPALGVALSACCAGMYAATTILGRRLARDTEPLALTTATTTVGAVVLLPFVLRDDSSRQLELASWGAVVYLGLMTMALAYYLLYAGLRTVSSSSATVATLIEPVTAAALAVVLLGERLTGAALVGGALVLAAVAGLTRATPEQVDPAPGGLPLRSG